MSRTPSPDTVVEVTEIKKRNGDVVPFDVERISGAIQKALEQTGEDTDARAVAETVRDQLVEWKRMHREFTPGVEGIQDMVEKALMTHERTRETAKAYILYRHERTEMREMLEMKRRHVPERVRELFEDSKKYFKNNPLGEFVYYRTYSRWIEEEGRRECWVETVDRYMAFMAERLGPDRLSDDVYNEVRTAILEQEVMPSMRLLQFAGDAARRSNICAFNCAYVAPTCTKDLADIMFISMQGTGVGFSVESKNVYKFPQIQQQQQRQRLLEDVYVIPDDTEGWCDAFKHGLDAWFAGKDVEFDYSLIRAAGERLKTKGGRASGPEPLKRLLQFARSLILKKQGKMLTAIEVHDLICYVGDIVKVGGVRRSAMISLSDLDDVAMSKAKSVDNWWVEHAQRSMANNSAVYEEKPTCAQLMKEWLNLVEGKSGERGIFNRGSLAKMLPERRIEFLKERGYIIVDQETGELKIVGIIGGNPCMEILLLSMEFCNVTEAVARPADDYENLARKVKIATILGTYQASLTDFPYISAEWKRNCDDEALLGVSITGMWDCPVARDPKVLRTLRWYADLINRQYAKRFGVNRATAITCIKPSGTVALTVDSSAGVHRRFAPYYVRRVRMDSKDSLRATVNNQGLPSVPEVGSTVVFEFPVKAPEGAPVASEQTALEQLEFWKLVKVNYCEHNPSCTIYVSEDEWIAVVNWVYENWDCIGGLSFFPRDDNVYDLAPFEEITEKQYVDLVARMPAIDYSRIVEFEREDTTDVKSQLACSGGMCLVNA